MTLEKIAMTQRAMAEEQQARIGNQKWTQYLAAFIGNLYKQKSVNQLNALFNMYHCTYT